MEITYLICAIVGGTLIVCQFLLTLLGMGGGHDTGADHDMGAGHDAGFHGADHHAAGGEHHPHGSAHPQGHSMTTWLFAMLTFRTVVAGMAFFGLTGLALQREGHDDVLTFLAAAGAGALAIFLVGTLMRSLTRLNVDGTITIGRSVGARGTVYLSIPADKAGAGKVHISVQGRSLEYKAITAGAGLPTGAKIIVTAIASGDTVEVLPATSVESPTHV